MALLADRRAQGLETLETLTADDLPKTGVHSVLGTVTMAELVNQWAAHDTMHIVQAERALMQAFIPASGPWRGYFTDHDVDLRPRLEDPERRQRPARSQTPKTPLTTVPA